MSPTGTARLIAASCALAALPAAGVQAQWTWQTPAQWEGPTRARTVEPADAGGMTLTPFELIADEIGRTPNPANQDLAYERIEGLRCIRKQFLLDDATAAGGVLCVLAERVEGEPGSTLDVAFNGKPLAYRDVPNHTQPTDGIFPQDHEQAGRPYKAYWRGGWHEIAVPADLLVKGLNTVVIRARPGEAWQAMIEPSLFPDRSALSLDGGRTWDSDHLGRDGNLDGEYLVRLNLRRHPPSGWVESEIVDLWLPGPGEKIARPATLQAVKLTAEADLPAGTSVELFARVGPTPRFDPRSWTAWAPANELADGKANGDLLSGRPLRFAQWRAVLKTDRRAAAPRLKAVRMGAVATAGPAADLMLDEVTIAQPTGIRGSVPFIHAPRGKRLDLLRERLALDAVIKDSADEFDALAALARHVGRKTRIGNHKPGTLLRDMPGYDAFLAMELADKVLVHGMCVHEGAMFAQLATAMGWPARRSTWSHAIGEAWLNGQGKWVAFDATGGFGYQTADGRGAGFMDISNSWTADGIVGEIFQAYPKAAGIERKRASYQSYDHDWLVRFFSRPWFVMRSNFLETDEPDEPGHGSYWFKYNGNLHYRHPLQDPLPWFDFYSRRLGDFNFTCNQTYLFLSAGTVEDTLQVALDHDTPNFARFEKRTGDGAWTACEAEFDWTLAPGRNVLQVRALNSWQAEAVDSSDPARIQRTLQLLPPIVTKAEVVRK